MVLASPDEILAQVAESSRNVKLGKGVVSKTSYVAAFAVLVWAIIVWRWSDNLTTDAGLLLAGLAASGFAYWYIGATQRFAEKNPGQALLEGAEFLEWTKIGAATKALPSPVAEQPLTELPPLKGAKE